MPRPATKRDEIINVARRLFAERGIKATTVRDIAHAAGVTEGALYRHFSGKDDLARYLFAGGAEVLYTHLESAMAAVTGAGDRLHALIHAFFNFAQRDPEVFGLIMARHYGGAGEVPSTSRLPKELFVQTIRSGIQAGQLRPMDQELAAALVIGMCVQSILFLQRGLIEQSAEEVCAEVCSAATRMLSI